MLGKEINVDVAILPNAIHKQYVDILAQFDRELEGTPAADPVITISRRGETLVREQSMILVTSPDSEAGIKPVYAYQIYIPRGWDDQEIKWEISYLGRLLNWGDLGSVKDAK
jgi:hypothetical protein